MKVLADASLPGLIEAFPEPFQLTLYHHPDEIARLIPGQDALLCRSTLKVNQSLLKNYQPRYVATASSGTDHLDHCWLESQNIKVIDAKGCNARSVADYVIASVAYLQKQQLIQGKKAGIIGYGKVGTLVASRLQAARFQTVLYDPLKELREPHSFKSCALDDLYSVDLLCIHAELHGTQPYPSKDLINSAFLSKLNPGTVIINAARGGIVNEEDLLRTEKLTYCTDVYLNEPAVDERIIDKSTLSTPHIAGHSLEAKYIAVAMVSERLHQIAGVPNPVFATPQRMQVIRLDATQSWQDQVLSLYNPWDETMVLKQAEKKEAAFIRVRKNHQNRHDFLLYSNLDLGEQSRLLLGE
jgi:erythronate-4-phosphate dehydrogenase